MKEVLKVWCGYFKDLTCLLLSRGKGRKGGEREKVYRWLCVLTYSIRSTISSWYPWARHIERAPSVAPSPFPSFFTFLRVEPSYKYDNTRGASSSHEITPFDPAPLLYHRHYPSPSMLPSPIERKLSLSTVMYYSSSSFAALRYWKSENAN